MKRVSTNIFYSMLIMKYIFLLNLLGHVDIGIYTQ